LPAETGTSQRVSASQHIPEIVIPREARDLPSRFAPMAARLAVKQCEFFSANVRTTGAWPWPYCVKRTAGGAFLRGGDGPPKL